MTNSIILDSSSLYGLFLAQFNAAPGKTYWSRLQELAKDGLNGAQVLDALARDPKLSLAIPANESDAAFAARLVNELIGANASKEASAAAQNLIQQMLGQGWTKSTVLDTVAKYLGTLPTQTTQSGFESANPYLKAATTFQNKVVAARYFSETMGYVGSELAKMRDAVSRINGDTNTSDTTLIERLISGFDQSREYELYQSFVLAFSAAPGDRLLKLMKNFVTAGLSNAEIIDRLLSDPVIAKLYAKDASIDAFAQKLVAQFTGESDPVAIKALAVSLISQVMEAGWTKGMTIDALAAYFRTVPATPEEIGYQANDPLTKIAFRLDNKALAARFYTDVLRGDADEIMTLQALISRIDEKSDLSSPLQSIPSLLARAESGRLQDGYIRGATVFSDTDNDGTFDQGEAFTLTDDQGNFRLEAAIGNLVAFGGDDTSTLLSFGAVYKAPAGSTVINPLTSLISALSRNGQSPADAQKVVVGKLGLPESIELVRYDPLAELAKTNASATTRAQAIDVFKAAAVVANTLSQSIAAVTGTGNVTEAEASAAALRALAQQFDGSSARLDLSQSATLTKLVLDTAAIADQSQKIAAVANDLGLVMQASNRAVMKVASDTAEVGLTAEAIIKAQKVAQGEAANAIKIAVKSGSSVSLVQGYTSESIEGRIAKADIGIIGNGLIGSKPNL
ncbi:MAG: hypothetical protein EB072_07670, partial [Betaproteobacteria bacterium]|nr:hypothetical protein [Betaproteobacteria bacterium]